MDKKQTAVEWLWTRLSLIMPDGFEDEFEQAKAMEKQQIIDAWRDRAIVWNSEQYYNETYGK